MPSFLPSSNLNLNTGWRIGEESFQAMVKIIHELKTQKIVEFGSGASSIRLAQEFPQVEIFSIEHDSNFLHETQKLKQQFAPQASLKIVHRPLVWQRYGLLWYFSYAPGFFPTEVDAVIVDGPPTALTSRGREACLHQIISNLKTQGKILLDDYGRREEQQIVKNWLATYSCLLQKQIIPTGHKICVLQKISPSVHRKFNLTTFRDNLRQSIPLAFYLLTGKL